jgi:hypothetical protein
MPIPILVLALVIVPLMMSPLFDGGGFILGLAAVLIAHPITYQVRKNKYFSSEQFLELRTEIESLVSEHNEVVTYLEEIRGAGAFELGSSSTGQHAHLANFKNTSSWNMRRDRNVAEYAPNVYNGTLQVVRRASEDPIKYLMKYFEIKADQETLADVQRVANDISRLEEAINNVKLRETEMLAKVNPPKFIIKKFAKEFWKLIGVHLTPIQVPYPVYKFQYVSAGGNSGQKVDIVLNTPTLDALSETLVEKIKWAKSAAGQRSLMTSRLRTWIKERDLYTCQMCTLSTSQEPNLLLEIDHKIPVSKGGLSEPENLQTLCWRCNRSKGSKIL